MLGWGGYNCSHGINHFKTPIGAHRGPTLMGTWLDSPQRASQTCQVTRTLPRFRSVPSVQGSCSVANFGGLDICGQLVSWFQERFTYIFDVYIYISYFFKIYDILFIWILARFTWLKTGYACVWTWWCVQTHRFRKINRFKLYEYWSFTIFTASTNILKIGFIWICKTINMFWSYPVLYTQLLCSYFFL